MAAASRVTVLTNLPGAMYARSGPLAQPTGLVLRQDGLLVGTASSGGTAGNGGLFTVAANGTYAEMMSLPSSLGPLEDVNQTSSIMSAPTLLLDGSANIYAWTFADGSGGVDYSGGSLFKVSLAGSVSTLYHFVPATGTTPAEVFQGPDGAFYGLAVAGVDFNDNVIFKLTPDGQESVLYRFPNAPPTGLVMGGDGNLYGVRPAGNQTVGGQTVSLPDVVFEVTPAGVFSVLHAFAAPDANGHNADGVMPNDLILAADGNFYGSTILGGSTGGGVVFRLTQGGQFTVLHTFDFLPGYSDASNGGYQTRSLQMGLDGNLYGVTYWGGANGWGSAFRLTTSGIYSTVHSFDRSTAAKPTSLVPGPFPRTFYGTTDIGGPQDGGTVFQMALSTKNDLGGTGYSKIIASAPGSLAVGGLTATGLVQTTNKSVAAGYYPVATGDFDGDGSQDVLWTSANNDLYIWYAHADGTFTSAYVGTYPAGWRVVGAGDIDGDGQDDILWINSSTHQFAYWLMKGATRVGSHTTSYAAGYYPVAFGDFDGDGKVDVLWSSANRDLWLWSSTGSGFASRYITTYPANWTISAVADLNGDGVDDLVWTNTNGTQWGYWLMHPNASPGVVSLQVPGSLAGYTVVAAGDYNGTGVADVIWRKGSQFVEWNNLGNCANNGACPSQTTTMQLTLPAGSTLLNTGIPSQ